MTSKCIFFEICENSGGFWLHNSGFFVIMATYKAIG